MAIRLEYSPVGAGGLAGYATGRGRARERYLQYIMAQQREARNRLARRQDQALQFRRQAALERMRQGARSEENRLYRQHQMDLERERTRRYETRETNELYEDEYRRLKNHLDELIAQARGGGRNLEEGGAWWKSVDDYLRNEKVVDESGAFDPIETYRTAIPKLQKIINSFKSEYIIPQHQRPDQEYEKNGWIWRNTEDGPVRVRPLDPDAAFGQSVQQRTLPNGQTVLVQPEIDRYGNPTGRYEPWDGGDTANEYNRQLYEDALKILADQPEIEPGSTKTEMTFEDALEEARRRREAAGLYPPGQPSGAGAGAPGGYYTGDAGIPPAPRFGPGGMGMVLPQDSRGGAPIPQQPQPTPTQPATPSPATGQPQQPSAAAPEPARPGQPTDVPLQWYNQQPQPTPTSPAQPTAPAPIPGMEGVGPMTPSGIAPPSGGAPAFAGGGAPVPATSPTGVPLPSETSETPYQRRKRRIGERRQAGIRAAQKEHEYWQGRLTGSPVEPPKGQAAENMAKKGYEYVPVLTSTGKKTGSMAWRKRPEEQDVRLLDGRTIRGRLYQDGDKYSIVPPDGETVTLGADEVDLGSGWVTGEFAVGAPETPAAAPPDEMESPETFPVTDEQFQSMAGQQQRPAKMQRPSGMQTESPQRPAEAPAAGAPIDYSKIEPQAKWATGDRRQQKLGQLAHVAGRQGHPEVHQAFVQMMKLRQKYGDVLSVEDLTDPQDQEMYRRAFAIIQDWKERQNRFEMFPSPGAAIQRAIQ